MLVSYYIFLDGIVMFSDGVEIKNLNDYKAIEIAFHRDLMNISRKYMGQLNLVSLIGTLETVKQETIELIKATNKPSFEKETQQKVTESL